MSVQSRKKQLVLSRIINMQEPFRTKLLVRTVQLENFGLLKIAADISFFSNIQLLLHDVTLRTSTTPSNTAFTVQQVLESFFYSAGHGKSVSN